MKTIDYRGGIVRILDQTLLPQATTVIECKEYSQVAEAIKSLRIRGAPCIGIAAALGVVLAARSAAIRGLRGNDLSSEIDSAIKELAQTRPTAVNLFWALQRMRSTVDTHSTSDPSDLLVALETEAQRIITEDEASSSAMAKFGAELIPDGANVLTHCNTGALAAGGFGTALGAIREAHDLGKRIHVWVDETRPLLQGARLTAWELDRAGIPFTLITDNMAAHFMSRGNVDLAMVGADRIVANGDGANKIGTYSVAVLAHAHGLPFYFVAPTTTVDLEISDGSLIPIEERPHSEVTSVRGVAIAPDDVHVTNPAFDVTPARLVTAIVTDRGIVRPPFDENLARATMGDVSQENKRALV